MKALLCTRWGGPEDLRVTEVEPPSAPGAGEVVVAIDHASVTHATGLMIAGRYQRRPPFPFAPGTEAVGRIAAVGPGQTRLRVGQRVALVADWGCFAELVRMRDDTVYPIPDGVRSLDVLPLPTSYGTAYTALFWRARLRRDDIVLVFGAGAGVGLAALELAVQAGARVIACASTEAKRQVALERGAWHAIDGRDLAATVKRLTDDHGADIVFDPVGGELFDAGVRAAAHNGQLLSIGFASGE
ncbi:MAG: zinc-binding dehydrogenase, partial [Burkholderiaceae bacterium]